jgi:DNA-binding GntR family transcriptional regulator
VEEPGSALRKVSTPNSPRAGTKGDQVEAAIRGYLASGEIGPGEKISLRKLAGALGVSVMPVRNAVARLQSDGVLSVEPGRAVRVPIMSAAQFRELTTIRMEVEGFAAERAALSRSDEDLEVMRDLSASFQILSMGRSNRSSGAARVNMEFHFAVYRASKMPLLVDIIERLWLKAGPVVFYYIYFERFPTPTNHGVALHRQAVEAIRKRDEKTAREAIVEDIKQAADRLLEGNIFKT